MCYHPPQPSYRFYCLLPVLLPVVLSCVVHTCPIIFCLSCTCLCRLSISSTLCAALLLLLALCMSLSLLLVLLSQSNQSSLIMLIVGTGKSEVNQAVLWYAFQHNASDMVVVTSYTWKAALLLSTPFNQGYSTSMLFGTNVRTGEQSNRRTPGTSDKSQHLLSPSVRLILHDEISFDRQEHFGVSN